MLEFGLSAHYCPGRSRWVESRDLDRPRPILTQQRNLKYLLWWIARIQYPWKCKWSPTHHRRWLHLLLRNPQEVSCEAPLLTSTRWYVLWKGFLMDFDQPIYASGWEAVRGSRVKRGEDLTVMLVVGCWLLVVGLQGTTHLWITYGKQLRWVIIYRLSRDYKTTVGT